MIYLDNAATSYPKPEAVYEAMDECMRGYCANPGRSGHKLSLKAGRLILEAREAVAGLFHIQHSERVIFTHNATDSINLGLKGLLKRGDHVITTGMEHNSVLRPLKTLESAGIETTIAKCMETGELDPAAVEKEIRGNTRLIVMTHASNVTGTILPVAAVGRIAGKRGVKLMVDAAQTAGVFDIDVQAMNIDLLAFPGHKGLFGPQGVGGLYIGPGVELFPLKEGGTGSSSESLLQPEILPDRYESGTPNTPGIAGLLAGLEFIKKTGMAAIREHEAALTQRLLAGLSRLDKVKCYGPKDMEKQAPVISINVGDAGSSEVSYLLDDGFDIATRPGLHCAPMAHMTTNTLEQGTVRFSIGYFNNEKEIDLAVAAIEKITMEI